MTSDRQPADIPDVDQRLLSRLSGGLIVDVGTPDYEMRLAILRNSCAERGLDFSPGVLEEVARVAFGNVRELKGALNKLSAYCQLEETRVSAEDVRAIIGERSGSSRTPKAVGVLRADGTIAEYDGFLADIVQGVETRVEPWRVRIGEACDRWKSQGFRTGVLERALSLPTAPDVDGLLTTFNAVTEHLRSIESRALAFDPSLRGHAAFRDPEKVGEAEALLERVVSMALPLPAANPVYRLDTFEAGPSNQLALKAVDEVLDEPGAKYNPLLVHGPDGTGKTHLVHALANALREHRPGAAIACLSAGTFMQELIAAMQEGGVERWRARYRSADLLVLDDLELLVERERTQEELFHLFNHLVARGSQVVIASSRPPRELIGLADRLRSRFEGGLVVSLQVPDRQLRERLATRWLRAARQQPDHELVMWMVNRSGGTRELRTLVTRLVSAAESLGIPLTLDLAERELQGAAATSAAVLSPRIQPGELDNAFLDREKVIWDWPDLGGQLVEELR